VRASREDLDLLETVRADLEEVIAAQPIVVIEVG
jgi:hypothetical protein